jgi:hypothetical protein
LDSGIGSLELNPGLFKRLQIGAQATLASGIGSLESIPGLLKRLQIRAKATLASGIGSLDSIPGLLKRLQIGAQATLASGIVSWNRFLGTKMKRSILSSTINDFPLLLVSTIPVNKKASETLTLANNLSPVLLVHWCR